MGQTNSTIKLACLYTQVPIVNQQWCLTNGWNEYIITLLYGDKNHVLIYNSSFTLLLYLRTISKKKRQIKKT